MDQHDVTQSEDSVMSDAAELRDPTPSPEAGPSSAPSAPTASTSQLPLQPSGPICSFGPRLAYTYFPAPIPDASRLNATGDAFWFTIDSLLLYLSFFQDTGPLNCACLYRFCLHLHGLIEDVSPNSPTNGKRIILYSSDEADKKANSSLLMALYCMVVLRWSPADALHPLAQLELQPFRDAGYARADFHLSAQNVLFGVRRAIDLRLLKLDEFDLKEYEMYEKVENGDYNWLSPGFIAFASPSEPGYSPSGTPAHQKTLPGRLPKAFRNVLDRFEKVNVKLVIRLNKKLYDEQHFLDRGIAHREMYFDDGTNPPMPMVREFIDICDKVVSDGGVVAVHCKAGLGRTGTLIGAYLIYKYGFTAEEAIGFMRVMRPGTCVGPQQHFLYENQMTWVRWAATDLALASQSPKVERPITPPSEEEVVVPPRTPTHSDAGIVVPGQPRKTPGAKKCHMIAKPETRPTGDDTDIEAEMQDEMQLIPEPAPAPLAASKAQSVTKTHSRTGSTPRVGASSRVGAASTRGLATNGSGSQVAKVVRPRSRPLSALSDNRHVDRLGLNSRGGLDAVKRSKGVKDLGTLFEAPPPAGETGPPGSDCGRYNLRGGAARAASGAFSGPGVPAPAVPTNVHASPTRLPQRVAGKRRGTVKEKMAGVAAGYAADPAVGNAGGGHLNARSVRRRRSSLGAADVLA